MRLGSLTFIIAALFLVSACETMDEKGGADARIQSADQGGQTCPNAYLPEDWTASARALAHPANKIPALPGTDGSSGGFIDAD